MEVVLRSFQSVTFDARQVGDEWFNADPRRFAVWPLLAEGVMEAIADEVEALVAEFVGSTSQREKADVMARLVEMHSDRLILWPMGALHGHSVLGRVDVLRQLHDPLQAKGSDLLQVLDEVENDPKGPLDGYVGRDRRTYAFSLWKSLASIRLAWTKRFGALRTYDHDAFEALAGVARPAGDWAAWFPELSRKCLRFGITFLAVERNDTHFGASVLRSSKSNPTRVRRHDPFKVHPHLGWLDRLFEEWLDTEAQVLMKRGPRVGKQLLGDFFSTLPPDNPSRIETAFNASDMSKLRSYANTWSTGTQRALAMSRINDFLNYLRRQHKDDLLGVEGPLFLDLEQHEVEAFKRSVKVPRSSSRMGEVKARPMPTKYHQLLKDLITENYFAWPKSLCDGRNGRPQQWMNWTDPKTGLSHEVFCPVLSRLLLLHLDLPLRNVQIRRLDSGEGDSEAWNPDTGAWEPNQGRHGGYWQRMGAVNPRRGVIRRLAGNHGRSIAGIWVNSNKTKDSDNLFDETSGYEIPWEHEEVLRNLAAMRDWQERFNPVDGPLAHADLPPHLFQAEPSRDIRALLPAHFYLFRYPLNTFDRGAESPPSYAAVHSFFNDALEELERRLNKENPDRPVKLITGRDASKAPNKAIYTIHGMRSSTLTELHLAGVPIEVLSKVVAGHASILMTLNYIKLDPLHVSQVLTEARLKFASEATDRFPDVLGKATFENAIKLTARHSDDGLAQMGGNYPEPSSWARLDIGVCPNGATQCRIGGEVIAGRIVKGVDKSLYGPVPGGPRNCVRCRFFVTGLPFLIALWSHASALMARADGAAKQAMVRDEEFQELWQRRKDLQKKKEAVPVELHRRIDMVGELFLADTDKRDQALADFHHTIVLIEKVRAISEQVDPIEGIETLPMLLPQEKIPELMGREATRFELIDAVVQQSRCFPSIESADIERERNEFLNQILHRNGFVPITMAPLSQSERRRAADAMAAFLLMELGAAETDDLATGLKSLSELGLQERLEAACRRAIGRPLERIDQQRTVTALLEDAR
jgi:hypothetical protein